MHAITASCALRDVMPYLEPAEQRQTLLHYWHALAAVHCMNPAANQSSPKQPKAALPAEIDQLELIEAAAKSLDDHAIKLCAVAIGEYLRTRDNRLLQAAWLYVLR